MNNETLNKEAVDLKTAAKTSDVKNKDAEAHRFRGDEKEISGDPVAAEREYEMALKVNPSEQNYFASGAELLLHRAGDAPVEVLTRGPAANLNSQRMGEALGATLYAS